MPRLVRELIEQFGDRFGTDVMEEIGKRAGQTYTAAEVRRIRDYMPDRTAREFPLKGEVWDCLPYRWVAITDDYLGDQGIWGKRRRELLATAAAQPESYPVKDFMDFCCNQAVHPPENAEDGTLEDWLAGLCLDPGHGIRARPWYCEAMPHLLSEYVANWITQRAASVVTTSLGHKVQDTLDYTLESRSMTLIEGDARIGKSFSARAWCETHTGQARFIEVPTGNDDTGFFRALARGLGIGSFHQLKACELRERVETVLLTGDLLLCLDEAHRLWPETNFRYGFPKRVNWLMSMANQGVPLCLIGTPQFIERQRAAETQSGWNSAQFMGRLGHFEPLPRELSPADLMAVAKAVLPEADKTTLRALAAYARTSARYLAAIDAIAKRARYIAKRDGRTEASTEDVRVAMQESVIPADSKLVRALASVNQPVRGRGRQPAPLPPGPAPVLVGEDDNDPLPPARDTGHVVTRNRLTAETLAGEAMELAATEN
ncbi:MAG: ATP-binding protein [Verrucomicrobia bacterium]|nr:ATP-binding protein [Verrucomicrobiota bacterium]